MSPRTDFLFASPSFVEGVARIMDFGNVLNTYNSSNSENEADAIALRMDWRMVGVDIQKAMELYSKIMKTYQEKTENSTR
jgi:hypothetical protein